VNIMPIDVIRVRVRVRVRVPTCVLHLPPLNLFFLEWSHVWNPRNPPTKSLKCARCSKLWWILEQSTNPKTQKP
jgi:hypothetical protein